MITILRVFLEEELSESLPILTFKGYEWFVYIYLFIYLFLSLHLAQAGADLGFLNDFIMIFDAENKLFLV